MKINKKIKNEIYIKEILQHDNLEWSLELKGKSNKLLIEGDKIRIEIPEKKKKIFKYSNLKYNEICQLYFELKKANPIQEVEDYIKSLNKLEINELILKIKNKTIIKSDSFEIINYTSHMIVCLKKKKIDLIEINKLIDIKLIKKIYINNKQIEVSEKWVDKIKDDTIFIILYK